ncbi:MAG: hypothetical protein ACJAWW_001943 [Sulfurimonas sp.]|jgi:hypothetical protein
MSKIIALSGSKKGVISVAKLDEPYGKGSHSVASIGISLTGNTETPDWKVHIPFENLDEVLEALQSLK